MFLKKIELSGFKSFADKTVISFENGVTGIVGPNGCGKSNLTDAIRWVLGEQSGKSLRTGSSMSDIVFSGSESRKPVGIARVTLVFDNEQKIFDSPFEEIEITREIKRSSGESSFYLNKTPCRLKDIADLVMDTGLGRDSLSIISQGNISSFADARPEERRLLFEEAAGVAKYKKRKKTSLAKLENVHANLERVQDHIDHLNEQLETLREQAQKARQYKTWKEELSGIEIALLARQISACEESLKKCTARLEQNQLDESSAKVRLNQQEDQLEQLRKQIFELDQQLSMDQNTYTKTLEESYALQRRKVEQDEKRKYAIDHADDATRIASLKEMLTEAEFEMKDRSSRLSEMRDRLTQTDAQIRQLEHAMHQAQMDLSSNQNHLNSLQSRKMVLENRLAAPYAHQQGVQAVLKARASLQGIEGAIGDLLRSDVEYAAMLSAALGGASEQIATRDDRCARLAIEFLKRSRAGRATFLPLSVCKNRSLFPDQQIIADHAEGILGRAVDFVSCDQKYGILASHLLGNILVADHLKNATEAAKTLKYKVKIVTLDGDVVHAGGSMSGGSRKSSNNAAMLKRDLEEVKTSIEKGTKKIQEITSSISDLSSKNNRLSENRIQLRIDYEKLENIYRLKKEKVDDLQAQLSSLNAYANTGSSVIEEDSLVAQISEVHARLDDLNSMIQVSRTSRSELASQADSLEGEIRQLRRTLSSLFSEIHSDELEKARTETRMEQALMRLNTDYSLTFEAASEYTCELAEKEANSRVKKLRSQIASLGDVNLSAPAQYDEVSAQSEFFESQKEELEAASSKLLDAIDEMDQSMIVQFTEMFNKINAQLDGIFKAMFGGGRASLSMTDPENILETGIDIDVQPPGKTVKNIQTFSGGEKALIAISVLFAILKARTMPLCIFDEAEAALDQANVERFARYISRFKDQSQFIVVTHRPGTMAQCDTLYGVTMQKDGVSRVLKVLLKDAAKMSQSNSQSS